MEGVLTSPADSPTVDFAAESLPIGSVVDHPIHDLHGVLLLAAKSTITPVLKDLLKSRGVNYVKVAEDDATRFTAWSREAPRRLSQNVDTLVDGGLDLLENQGPGLKRRPVDPTEPYDQESAQRLATFHSENQQRTGQALQQAATTDESVDSEPMQHAAESSVNELCHDTDCMLASLTGINDVSITAKSLKVSTVAMAMAIESGFDARVVREIGIAALVHDWGMLLVPEDLRRARRRLSQLELLEIQKHPGYTLDLLRKVEGLSSSVSIIAYQVHERMDGSGYPRGKTGPNIHPASRIISVADVFVSMSAPRPYRPPLMKYGVMESLLRQVREGLFAPDVVRSLLMAHSLFGIGSYVLLDDQSIAQVMRRNRDEYSKPVVRRVLGANGEPVSGNASDHIIDLTEARQSIARALPTPGSGEVTDETKLYQR